MSDFWFSNLFYLELSYSGSATAANFRTDAVSNGWNGTDPIHLKVTVTGNRGSPSTGTPALQTGSPFPTGSLIELTNNSGIYISGAGGPGGSTSSAGNGLHCNYPITLNNLGTIQGGGYGGANGSPGSAPGGENHPPIYYSGGAGGGGAGYVAGSPGGSLTGGGGGGSSSRPSNVPFDGGAGGSGIVIIRAPADKTLTVTPGTNTTSTHPAGCKLATFTVTGCLTIS